eukprot:7115372-Pyramimonas_sp.AAC.1
MFCRLQKWGAVREGQSPHHQGLHVGGFGTHLGQTQRGTLYPPRVRKTTHGARYAKTLWILGHCTRRPSFDGLVDLGQSGEGVASTDLIDGRVWRLQTS